MWLAPFAEPHVARFLCWVTRVRAPVPAVPEEGPCCGCATCPLRLLHGTWLVSVPDCVDSAAVNVYVRVQFSACVFDSSVFIPRNRMAELDRRILRSVAEWLFFPYHFPFCFSFLSFLFLFPFPPLSFCFALRPPVGTLPPSTDPRASGQRGFSGRERLLGEPHPRALPRHCSVPRGL